MPRASSKARMNAWSVVEVKAAAFREARGPGGSVWKALELADELAAALDTFALVRPRVFNVERPTEQSTNRPEQSTSSERRCVICDEPATAGGFCSRCAVDYGIVPGKKR